MSYFSKRAVRWAAPVVLVGALGLAACGDGDDAAVQTRAPAAPSAADVAGSDQHLGNLAEQVREARANAAASARLQGQAEAHQRVEVAQAAVAVSSRAELADQQSAYQAGSRPNVSVAYRAAQRAAADRYVEQQQARAAGAAKAYGDEQREPTPNGATTQSPVNPVEAADAAIAAQAERQAQLEGQARTYGADQ